MTELTDAEQIAAEEGEPIEPEPDQDEEVEEQEEPEPEPQPQPENKLSMEAMEAREKAAEREHKRHENALAKIHGPEEWDSYSICPLCIGNGFLTPWNAGEMVQEQYDAVIAFAGRTEPIEYKESSFHERCGECDGHGHTISGAQPPLDPLKLCDACSGNGYVSKAPKLPTYQPPTQNGADLVPQLAAIPNYGSSAPDDQWGRPAGHVHYGIPPAAVIG